MTRSRTVIFSGVKRLYISAFARILPWLIVIGVPFGALLTRSDWLHAPTIPAAVGTILMAGISRNACCLVAGCVFDRSTTCIASYGDYFLKLYLETNTLDVDVREIERLTVSAWQWAFFPWITISITRHDGSRLKIQTAITHPRLLLLLRRVSRDVRRLNTARGHREQDV